jgi:surface polysaccharide O-acyltransferase-like enzyme
MNKTRIIYFDYLRILAALAVVMLHTAASQYSLTDTYHYTACFWDGIARWGVPIFVMISGALFLEPSKTITIKNIFNKYIFHIAVLFVVWSLFYTCLCCFAQNNFGIHFIIKHCCSGYYHLWFLYMIAGLYLISPLLRPIIQKEDKNLLLFLLILWFVMSSIIPFINFILPQTKHFCDLIIKTKLKFSFPLSFVGYFVLGYYLHKYINIKRTSLIICILLFCLAAIVVGDIKYSVPGTDKQSFFFNAFCPFVIFTAISIFLLLKNKCLQAKQNKIILQLSNLTLGVYLIHPFFIMIAKKLNLFNNLNHLLSDKNLITIPLVFIIVGVCSFSTTYVLSKIPLVKKYCL